MALKSAPPPPVSSTEAESVSTQAKSSVFRNAHIHALWRWPEKQKASRRLSSTHPAVHRLSCPSISETGATACTSLPEQQPSGVWFRTSLEQHNPPIYDPSLRRGCAVLRGPRAMLFPGCKALVLGLVLGPCWWLKHQGRTCEGGGTPSVSL